MSPEAREIFEAMDEQGWSLTDRVDAIVAAAVLATGCFVGGFELRGGIGARDPVPVAEMCRAPLSQWDCSDQEFRERAFACNQRERSTAVKPPPTRKSL